MIVREVEIKIFCDVCWEDSDHEKRIPASTSKVLSADRIRPRLVEVCVEHTIIDLSHLEEFLDKYGHDPDTQPRPPHRASAGRTGPQIMCKIPGCTNAGPFKSEAGLKRHTTRQHGEDQVR